MPPGLREAPAAEKTRLHGLARTYLQAGKVAAKARQALLDGGCAAADALWSASVNHADATLLQECWEEHALHAYGRAFDLALADGARTFLWLPREGHHLAPEAGQRYLELLRA